jgi:hypothetical protein
LNAPLAQRMRYPHCSHAHLAAKLIHVIDAGLFLQFAKARSVNPLGFDSFMVRNRTRV